MFRSVIAASVASSIATTALLAMHPAAYAASAFASVASAVSCATTGACVSGTNSSSGPGVSGTSAKGYGVEGVSTSNDGLKGISTSSNGLSASSTSSYGVKGESSSSYGVYASSSSGGGILGQTSATKAQQAGVTGKDVSSGASRNIGVLGSVTSGGYGVEGTSQSGAYGGVFGNAYDGDGVVGSSANGAGMYASSEEADGLYAESEESYGVYARNHFDGTGLYADGDFDGVVANSDAGTPLLASSNFGTVFSVDEYGDVQYSGTITSVSRAKGGATIKAYATKTTRPTIEDTGIARLTGGNATVTLDPAFASSIDRTNAYAVLITPEGETRGLYVAAKDLHGFSVRETGGGRSSVPFDYRVVAVAAGHASERMAPIDPATIPHVDKPKAPRGPFGRVPH